MGDMADDLIDSMMDREDDERFAGDDIDDIDYSETPLRYCKYCKRGGLHWENGSNGWRLFDRLGEMHSCKQQNKQPMAKQIAIDFDGTIHEFTTPWSQPDIVSDGPTDGALEFLADLDRAGFRIAIYSPRNRAPGGVAAIRDWLARNSLDSAVIARIAFPLDTPSTASVFIDDRAFLFKGTWPTLEYLSNFKPWNKQ